MPKISVIIPVYKVEDYIRECLDSIKNQTFADFEVLLIDDGSPDSSGAICDEYAAADARFKVFHKPNGGVSSARNMGLDNAKGEWITFIDPDDYLLSNDTYKEIIQQIGDENYDLIKFGFTDSLGEHGFPFYPFNVKYKKLNRNDILKNFLDFYNVTFCLFKRRKIRSLRFENLKISEDTLFVRLFLLDENVNSILLINKLYYFYRTNENSVMNNFYPHHLADVNYSLYNILKKIDENNLDVDKTKYRKHIVESFFSILIIYSNYKTVNELAEIIKKYASPFDLQSILTYDIIFEHKKPYISYLLVKFKLYKLAALYIERKGITKKFIR